MSGFVGNRKDKFSGDEGPYDVESTNNITPCIKINNLKPLYLHRYPFL